MRGKVIVIGLLVVTVVVLIFGLWFLNTRSPLDQRFNLKRGAAPGNAALSVLLPEKVEDFQRQSLTPFEATSSYGAGGGAVYFDSGRKTIVLTARQNMAWPSTIMLPPTSTFTTHFDANLPYIYGKVDGQATFIWGNNGWVLSASAPEADAELLLQFVNLYPY